MRHAERMKPRTIVHPSGVHLFHLKNSIFVTIETEYEEVSRSSIAFTFSSKRASAKNYMGVSVMKGYRFIPSASQMYCTPMSHAPEYAYVGAPGRLGLSRPGRGRIISHRLSKPIYLTDAWGTSRAI